MSAPLTARERQCLDFIRERAAHRERPPTMREICDRMRISSLNYAWQLVDALRGKGYVRRNGFRHTGISLLPQRADSRFFLVLPELCDCGATYFGARCPACAGVFQEKAS